MLAAALRAVVFEQISELCEQSRRGAVGHALAVPRKHRSGETAPP